MACLCLELYIRESCYCCVLDSKMIKPCTFLCEFASLLMLQALSTAHPWGIKTHTELHLPNKISPEAKSLLREVQYPDELLSEFELCYV